MKGYFEKGDDPRRHIAGRTGGKRSNAGRKAGSENRFTREQKALALEGGLSPLQMMVNVARWHYIGWEEAIEKNMPADEQVARAARVHEVAKDVAPYLHHKLAAIQHSGPGGGPIPLDLTNLTNEQLEALEPVIAALASTSPVAGADPSGEGEAED